MFWSTNSVSSSHLETLLSKEDVTLQELMDEEEILQECKSQNKRLIDYLLRSDVLEELVTLTTVEPSGDGDENIKYKYPNIACELLTSEVPQLNQRLANDEVLLGKLYAFLEGDAPLNPLLASFFSKTFSVLIARTSEQNWYSYQFTCLQVLEFLKSKENCISLLLKHLGTSAIMDLLLKLITKVEGVDMKQNILNWLSDMQLVQNLVALLDPSIDSNVQNNASQLLCDVIKTARENRKQVNENTDQDSILEKIESPETVSSLLDYILKEPKCESSIVGGISVLLTLLKCFKKDTNDVICNMFGSPPVPPEDISPDSTEPSKVVLNTIEAVLPRIKDFHDILVNPPTKPAVNTTIGVLDPPLGKTRVKVTKLISALVASNSPEVNQEFAQLGTINVLLDLFFKYTWNNFLHTQVTQCLTHILNAEIPADENLRQNCLIAHILVNCRLLERILDAWEENDDDQTKHNSPRRGYMGHLIKISNIIVQQAEKGPLGALMKEVIDGEIIAKWETFVTTKLNEINETHSKCLGGIHPLQSNNDDNNVECKDGFMLDNNLQELYSNYYQLQAMAPSFAEPFGSYQEEQFNDNEDILNSSADPSLQKLSFNINEEDLDTQAALFEQVCAQKFQTLEDDGDMWKDASAKSERQKSFGQENNANSSSDEEEEEEDEEPQERSGPEGREDTHIEQDSLSSTFQFSHGQTSDINWPADKENLVAPLEDRNPWASVILASTTNANIVTSPDQGWANFESAPFVADFGLNLTSDIKTTIASSGSCEIETIPLDLTPNDTSVNVNEIFTRELEPEMECPQIVENVPVTVEYTTFDNLANVAVVDLSFQPEDNVAGVIQTESEAAKGDFEDVTTDESTPTQPRSTPTPESDPVGDVNTLGNASDQEELIDNFRFLSTQGLITKCEQPSEIEPESRGDGYQLLKENVQVVPNETTQTSNKNVEIIGSRSSAVTTTNGPV